MLKDCLLTRNLCMWTIKIMARIMEVLNYFDEKIYYKDKAKILTQIALYHMLQYKENTNKETTSNIVFLST